MPSDANVLGTKGNVVLYLDRELVQKSKELGFNLSKTLENHLKQLVMQFSTLNPVNNDNIAGNLLIGSPGEIRTLVGGSKARYAWPLHHRALAIYLLGNTRLASSS